MKVYKCDNESCQETSEDLKGWIQIGTESGDRLKITNNTRNAALVTMDNHRDIHFCSDKCLCRFLFM